MSRIDKEKLLHELQADARARWCDLADMFGVSETAIRKAVHRLEDQCIILGYTAKIDWECFKMREVRKRCKTERARMRARAHGAAKESRNRC